MSLLARELAPSPTPAQATVLAFGLGRNRVASWLFLGLLFVAAVTASSGCAPRNPRPGDFGPRPYEFLPGNEVAVEEGMDARMWVTAERSVRLRYRSLSAREPDFVQFLVRAAGTTDWAPGPSWIPGHAAPAWNPPSEGRWEIRASRLVGTVESGELEAGPHVIVAFDWSPPQLTVRRGLPARAIRGGESVILQFGVDDEFLEKRSLRLEMSEFGGKEWREVTRLPLHGEYEWTVPNRALAGAQLRIVATDLVGHRGWQNIPGQLTVEGMAPVASVPDELRVRQRPARIPYEVNWSNGGDPTRVELWVTQDNGATWRLAGYDHDLVPPLDIDIAEGEWGYQIVLEDEYGNRSNYPRPGIPPAGRLLVDTTAPQVKWGPLQVIPAQASGSGELDRLRIQGTFEIEDVALDASTIRLQCRATGGEWRPISGNFDESFDGNGEYSFLIYDRAPEPIEIRVRGFDLAGNAFLATNSVYPQDHLRPPVIVFDDSPTGWRPGGEEVLLRYHVTWLGAEEDTVSIAYTFDGTTWHPLANGLSSEGTLPWTLPSESQHSVRLRLGVRGRDGRQLYHSTDDPFGIDSEAPRARILGPSVGFGEELSLLLEADDSGGSKIDYVELFARRSGTTEWVSIARGLPDPDRFSFRPPSPGEYDLWLVPVDRAGNRGFGPDGVPEEDLFAFTVESGPPGIQLRSFQEGGVFAGGSRHFVFLDWSTPRRASGVLDLQYSPDDGGTWRPIQRVSLSESRVGWVLPKEDIATCRVRAIATEVTGRRTEDKSEIAFQIDATNPETNLLGVSADEEGILEIQFEARDRGAGVQRVWAYYTRDEGSRWQRWPEPFAPTAPIRLPLEMDSYGFFLQAEDAVGNLAAAPVSGTAPQSRYRLGGSAGLEFSLLHPTGGVLAGGTRHYVFWRLDPDTVSFSPRGVTLEYRADEGDWRALRKGLPLVGRTPWYVPEEEGARIELRMVAHDVSGQRYEARTQEPIVVDSSTPQAVYTGPLASNKRPLEVEYQLVRGDALSRVELWIRAVSTPDWTRVAEADVGTPLKAEIPDGMYRATVVASDAAGNRGKTPIRGEPGASDLLVDTVAPLLEVDGVGERERLFHVGDWVVLRPRANDRHLSAFPISFRVSYDGGEKFRDLKRYHPNAEEFPWRIPDSPGLVLVEVTAEDLAGNRAREVIPLQILPTPPQLTLLTDPGGGIFPAGEEMRLEWESRGVEPGQPGVRIEFAPDGEQWQELAARVAVDGHFVWKLPTIDSTRCRLRLTVVRPDGLMGQTESGVFTISSTAPRIKVDGVAPKDG